MRSLELTTNQYPFDGIGPVPDDSLTTSGGNRADTYYDGSGNKASITPAMREIEALVLSGILSSDEAMVRLDALAESGEL